MELLRQAAAAELALGLSGPRLVFFALTRLALVLGFSDSRTLDSTHEEDEEEHEEEGDLFIITLSLSLY